MNVKKDGIEKNLTTPPKNNNEANEKIDALVDLARSNNG